MSQFPTIAYFMVAFSIPLSACGPGSIKNEHHEDCVPLKLENGGPFFPVDECFLQNELVEFDGYLNYQSEGVTFHQRIPTLDDIYANPRTQTWVTFSDDAKVAGLERAVYRLKGAGRRSQKVGEFGHEGLYGHLLYVETIVSLEKVSDLIAV